MHHGERWNVGAVGMIEKALLYKILANNTGAEVSASGNPATLPWTLKNNPMNEMKVFGWSKQERTTGANLIDVNSMLNDCLIKNEDETYSIKKTEDNRFSKAFPVNLTAGTVVRFEANVIDYNGMYGIPLQVSIGYQTIPVGIAITLDSDISKVSIYQDAKNDVGTYTKFKNAILSIGRTQIPYEPYTGGQPSPSPDYPQQIVSAGNSGNIEVNVRGKNLVDVYGYSANDIPSPKAERVLFNTYGTTLSTTEKTDKLIVHQEIIDGASINSYTSGYFCIGINRKLENDKDYIITFNIDVIQNPFSASVINVLFNGIEAYKAKIIGDKVTVKAKNIEYRERQYVEVRTCGMSMEISNFMITEKDENTIYEPYYESQSLSISTPTGLPAIPVDTDGNYTDANGQQWITDYIDLKRGKYVQMVDIEEVTDAGAIPDTYFPTAVYTPKHEVGVSAGGISNYGFEVRASNAYGTNFGIFELNKYFDTLEDWKEWIDTQNTKGNAIDCYLPLKEPIERDLTTEEIQAYKNLVTYAGTTIVENDAECYMEVSAGGGDALRAKKLALILGD